MNSFERIAEAKIRQGQAAGEFSGLAPRRRRLALELKRNLATDKRLGRL